MQITILIGSEGALSQATLDETLGVWSEATGHSFQIIDTTNIVSTADRLLNDALDQADGVVIESGHSVLEHSTVGDPAKRERLVVAELSQLRSPAGRLSPLRVVWGRGIETFRWAAQALVNHLRSPAARHRYGSDADQFAELRVPTSGRAHPVVVLIHGGFWRSHWELDLMDDLAIDLIERGYATWNLEYRRGRGSISDAIADVDKGIDYLATLSIEAVDLDRVAIVGHSAGGHLAMLKAQRSSETVSPALCLGLAPVADLIGCARRGLGDGAAAEFVGAEPDSSLDVYRAADPSSAPRGGVCPVAVVQGLADSTDLIDFNRRYHIATEAHLVEVPGANHFDVIDPAATAWRRAEAIIAHHLGPTVL